MKNGLPAEEKRPAGRGKAACRTRKSGLPAEEELFSLKHDSRPSNEWKIH
jgi:hypothetical protein